MKFVAALLVLCVLLKVQGDVLHNPEVVTPGILGEPLQIVKFINESSVIDFTLLNNLLLNKEIKNREIVAVSIIGETRGAKSFFLNYCLRFLYANVSE